MPTGLGEDRPAGRRAHRHATQRQTADSGDGNRRQWRVLVYTQPQTVHYVTMYGGCEESGGLYPRESRGATNKDSFLLLRGVTTLNTWLL